MIKSPRQTTELEATRDEIIRALLDVDHPEADELGRTRLREDEDGWAPHASPREQAAAPINVLEVDE